MSRNLSINSYFNHVAASYVPEHRFAGQTKKDWAAWKSALDPKAKSTGVVNTVAMLLPILQKSPTFSWDSMSRPFSAGCPKSTVMLASPAFNSAFPLGVFVWAKQEIARRMQPTDARTLFRFIDLISFGM